MVLIRSFLVEVVQCVCRSVLGTPPLTVIVLLGRIGIVRKCQFAARSWFGTGTRTLISGVDMNAYQTKKRRLPRTAARLTIAMALLLSIGCHTAQGVKQDTKSALDATGRGLQNAAAKIDGSKKTGDKDDVNRGAQSPNPEAVGYLRCRLGCLSMLEQFRRSVERSKPMPTERLWSMYQAIRKRGLRKFP